MNKQTTALQLHINDLEKAHSIVKELGLVIAMDAVESAINNAKFYLPKEKEQIFNAFNEGYRDAENEIPIADGKDVSQFSNAQFYFSETYTTP